METVKCRRCGLDHLIDTYRGVRYYICDLFNRVLLLNDGEENDTTKTDQHREDPPDAG